MKSYQLSSSFFFFFFFNSTTQSTCTSVGMLSYEDTAVHKSTLSKFNEFQRLKVLVSCCKPCDGLPWLHTTDTINGWEQ